MPEALVVATVGSGDVQYDFPNLQIDQGLGPQPHVNSRAIGAWLRAELAERPVRVLRDIVTHRTLRNGPCYERISLAHPLGEWKVLLLATDQPEDVDDRYRASDTADLARVQKQWIKKTYPGTRVTMRWITVPPHLPSQDLAGQIERYVREQVAEGVPEKLYVLSVGGTPAMRMCTERAVGLVKDTPVRMCPQPSGGVLEEPALVVLERDRTRNALLEIYDQAFHVARFEAAVDAALTLQRHDGGTTASRLLTWAIAARTLASGRRPKPGTLIAAAMARDDVTTLEKIVSSGPNLLSIETSIAIVRRAARDGRWAEALAMWTTVAETFPRFWAAERGVGKVALVRPVRFPCRKSTFDDRYAGDVTAELLARCAEGSAACEGCPLGTSTFESLAADPRGAAVARALLPRTPHRIRGFRNAVVHPRKPIPGDITERLEELRNNLEGRGMRSRQWPQRAPAALHLAEPLALIFEQLTGQPPRDPFAILEPYVHRTIGQTTQRVPARPDHS